MWLFRIVAALVGVATWLAGSAPVAEI